MAYSETKIANIALSSLGEDTIRSFQSENENARRCNVLYPMSVDYVLGRGDWSFARATAQLNALAESLQVHPMGTLYALPSDCITPLRIYPRGSHRTTWEIEGGNIIIPSNFVSTSSLSYIYLRYTAEQTGTRLFTQSFINAVIADLEARLIWPLTGDRRAMESKRQIAEATIEEMLTEDANRGSQYRHPDEDPDNDRFVSPDAGQVVYYGPESSST